MKFRQIIPLFLAAGLLGVSLTMPGPVRAEDMDMVNPQEIKQEINRLLVLYTENHPDVQRLRHRLEKAKKVQAEKRARLKAERAAREKAAAQAKDKQ